MFKALKQRQSLLLIIVVAAVGTILLTFVRAASEPVFVEDPSLSGGAVFLRDNSASGDEFIEFRQREIPTGDIVPISHGRELRPEYVGREGAVNAGLVSEDYDRVFNGTQEITQSWLNSNSDIVSYENGVPVIENFRINNGTVRLMSSVDELIVRYCSVRQADAEDGILSIEWCTVWNRDDNNNARNGKGALQPTRVYRSYVTGGDDTVHVSKDYLRTEVIESILIDVRKGENSHSDGVHTYGITELLVERSMIVPGPPRRGSAVFQFNDAEASLQKKTEIKDNFIFGGNHVINSGPDLENGVFTGNDVVASSSKESKVVVSRSKWPNRSGSVYTLFVPDFIAEMYGGVGSMRDVDGNPWSPSDDGIAEGTPVP